MTCYSLIAARPSVLEKDPEKQKELYQLFMQNTIGPHVTLIEKKLEENGTGFLVGSEVLVELGINKENQINVIPFLL
jgi:hypothetical protein